ncbi:MAG TPA: amidohydrolase, partial [Coriobacteriia bacterium]|nr:amidohydrolase [Coriobacteriia bacterium]
AAYIAAILPSVYLDLSVCLPWASLGVDRQLEMLIGAVPTSKLLYGSDAPSGPELLWATARTARASLARVLSRAVETDHVTLDEADAIGRGILGLNTLRVHGLDG